MVTGDYSKIGPTAFSQASWRAMYEVPYAEKIAEMTKAHERSTILAANRDVLVPIFEVRFKGTNNVMREFIKKNINRVIMKYTLHAI